MSETRAHGENLKQFCNGYGLDVGYGGDPILRSSITVDLHKPYANVGNHPLNLGGDARDLNWFRNDTLDYVYSSHCLEDFINTKEVLIEWLRVVKKRGRVVLLLPDQVKYEESCKKHGEEPNASHKIKSFSLSYIKNLIKQISCAKIIYEQDNIGEYNFQVVIEKTKSSGIFSRIIYEIRVIILKIKNFNKFKDF
jgi:predicted SAM-dependent methyltransferase